MALALSKHAGLQTIDLECTCVVMVVEEQGCAVLFYLIVFSDNAISASAAAFFVHRAVAQEHLNTIQIDGGDFPPSKLPSLMLISSYACGSFGMPRVVAAEAASRGF